MGANMVKCQLSAQVSVVILSVFAIGTGLLTVLLVNNAYRIVSPRPSYSPPPLYPSSSSPPMSLPSSQPPLSPPSSQPPPTPPAACTCPAVTVRNVQEFSEVVMNLITPDDTLYASISVDDDRMEKNPLGGSNVFAAQVDGMLHGVYFRQSSRGKTIYHIKRTSDSSFRYASQFRLNLGTVASLCPFGRSFANTIDEFVGLSPLQIVGDVRVECTTAPPPAAPLPTAPTPATPPPTAHPPAAPTPAVPPPAAPPPAAPPPTAPPPLPPSAPTRAALQSFTALDAKSVSRMGSGKALISLAYYNYTDAHINYALRESSLWDLNPWRPNTGDPDQAQQAAIVFSNGTSLNLEEFYPSTNAFMMVSELYEYVLTLTGITFTVHGTWSPAAPPPTAPPPLPPSAPTRAALQSFTALDAKSVSRMGSGKALISLAYYNYTDAHINYALREPSLWDLNPWEPNTGKPDQAQQAAIVFSNGTSLNLEHFYPSTDAFMMVSELYEYVLKLTDITFTVHGTW